MRAIELANDLTQKTQGFLRLEAQPFGNYAGICPGCHTYLHEEKKASFILTQIGEEAIVRCIAGCDDETLLKAIQFFSPGDRVLTVGQYLDREVTRGHDREYLKAKLSKALALPGEQNSIPKALTFQELLSLKVEPRKELCGPWLKERTLTEVYGWRGAGKSWFGLWLSFCVSAGVDFMRWGVGAPAGVLYVDGEMDLEDIQERLNQIHQGEQKRAGRPLTPNLRYIADSNLASFPDGLPKLSTKEGRAIVEANLEGVSLVVLDNLSTLYNSAFENDAESWVEVQDWLVSLRRRGLSVVFVHHAGKGGQQRGASKREDVVNNVIALKQPENHQAEDGATFTLKFEKSRGVKGPAVASFAASLRTDEDGDLTWVLSDARQTQKEQALELHRDGMGVKAIARTLNINPGNVSRYLSQDKNKVAGGGVAGLPPLKGEGGNPPTPPKTQAQSNQATPKATPRQPLPTEARVFNGLQDKVRQPPRQPHQATPLTLVSDRGLPPSPIEEGAGQPPESIPATPRQPQGNPKATSPGTAFGSSLMTPVVIPPPPTLGEGPTEPEANDLFSLTPEEEAALGAEGQG